MYTLFVSRDKRKGKKQMIVGDNLTTISRHTPLRVKEDTIEH
jgi:hypothetical protein